MRALVFDTETTGLPLHPDAPLELQPRVIEFGGLLVDCATGDEVQSWSLIINPKQTLDPVITKITGLTDADLVDAPAFGDVWPVLREAFEAADFVVAHNAPFDTSLIDFELRRLGVSDFAWPMAVCTVQEVAESWGKRPKLIDLYQALTGQEFAQKHRALDDVRHLARVCVELGLFSTMEALP